MTLKNIYIGTSGWTYQGWTGNFYPEDIKSDDYLCAYSRHFKTVEINNSFYKLPSPKSVKNWHETVPEGFIFSCKASRYITHMKKLTEPKTSFKKFFKAIEPLEDKTGPVLFQLPPRWHINLSRLEQFIKSLPQDYRYSFEFRDPSWLCEDTYEILEKHNCALCFYDYKNFQAPEILLADFVYVRLHGPKQNAYEGSYDGRTLSAYARKIKKWRQQGKKVFCYFDNDQKGCAPVDAFRLIEKITGRKDRSR